MPSVPQLVPVLLFGGPQILSAVVICVNANQIWRRIWKHGIDIYLCKYPRRIEPCSPCRLRRRGTRGRGSALLPSPFCCIDCTPLNLNYNTWLNHVLLFFCFCVHHVTKTTCFSLTFMDNLSNNSILAMGMEHCIVCTTTLMASFIKNPKSVWPDFLV